jgi:AmiR/NasT family two-component response regulator
MNRHASSSPLDPAVDQEEELRVALRRLLTVTGVALEQRANLERALESRIEIEQAKGVLAERLRLPLDLAFELLRQTARAERRTVHELAREVLEQGETPRGILGRLHTLLAADDPAIRERRKR